MNTRSTALLLGGLLALGLLLPVPAFARGGRYAGPKPTPPAPAAEAEEPTESPGAGTSAPPTREETPAVGLPRTDAPSLGGGSDGMARGRRAGVRAIGMTDWLHWYETNREQFEDLRAGRLLTPTNPIFGVGDASGPGVGKPIPRVSDRTRAQILAALARVRDPEAAHWIHTEAAALIALGKLATRAADVAPLFGVVENKAAHSAYVRESAVLGLGHLRRTERTRQLDGDLLDRARTQLLAILKDGDELQRTRAFAAVSLGMLGSQPGARGAQVGAWTAEQLFRTWVENGVSDEIQVGLLLGLARQAPADVTPVMRLVLEGCAVRGREWPDPRSPLVRAHALLALARVGDARNATAIAGFLGSRQSGHAHMDQAAAIAAALLGERLPAARAVLAPALANAVRSRVEPGSLHLTLIALGRLIAAEAMAGEDAALAIGGKVLVRQTTDGTAASRSFAALGLALAIRPVDAGMESEAHQRFRLTGLAALRKGLGDRRADTHTQAAFATAIGIARDGASAEQLIASLTNEDESPELRAYAGLALGLMGDGRESVIDGLAKAIRDPRSELLRMRAATALGLVGSTQDEDERQRRLDELVEAMRSTRSQTLKGQIAITLARLGDARAVKPLLDVLEGSGEAHLNRAVACAGLGLLGDGEIHPTLSHTRQTCQYLAGSDVVRELLDLL